MLVLFGKIGLLFRRMACYITSEKMKKNEQVTLPLTRDIELLNSPTIKMILKEAIREEVREFLSDTRQEWQEKEIRYEIILRAKEPEETIRVDFMKGKIVVNGSPMEKSGPLLLAEYIILKQRKVNWLWAYVILERFKVTDPKTRFRNYIHKRKNELAEYGIHIEVLAGEDFAKLDFIEDRVVSNIKDIVSDYREALSLNNDGKTLQAIQRLSSLIENKDHDWYTFTDAYIDLARWVHKRGFEGVQPNVISKCKRFLGWYVERLRFGISSIEVYIENQKKDTKMDHRSEEEYEEIKKEFKKASELYSTFIHMNASKAEDLEYEDLKDVLIKTRGELLEIKQFLEQQGNKDPYEVMSAKRSAPVTVMKDLESDNEHVAEIIKYGLDVIHSLVEKRWKWKSPSDMEVEDRYDSICWHIGQLIIELENFDKFEREDNRLSALKKHFRDQLGQRLK